MTFDELFKDHNLTPEEKADLMAHMARIRARTNLNSPPSRAPRGHHPDARVDVAAQAIAGKHWHWDKLVEDERNRFRERARDVLAALDAALPAISAGGLADPGAYDRGVRAGLEQAIAVSGARESIEADAVAEELRELLSTEAPALPEGAEQFVKVPTVASDAMLRPFYECPPEELQLAWQAALHIAAVELRKGPLLPAAFVQSPA